MKRLSIFQFAEHVHVEEPRTGRAGPEDSRLGRVGPIALYPTQRDFLHEMFEARDEFGLRKYRRGVFSLPKKSGKTATGALCGLYMLCFDEFELTREVDSIATDLDQARLIFTEATRMVERSPILKAWVKAGVLRIYRDAIELKDGDTFGVFRCLASDTQGLHGISPSCLLVDETWTMQTYDLLEACSLPPTRRCPLELHFTYAGLRVHQRDGVPLWDLFRASESKSDPKLYFVYRHGREANALVPWITEEYLRGREAALPTNRFRRLHYNLWGTGDSTFLTEAEIERALDPLCLKIFRDKAHPWVAAIDYGRVHDMTAICVARQREDGVVQVGELLLFRGSRENPVPLGLVEDEVATLGARFDLARVIADEYQMHGSVERLRDRGVAISAVHLGPQYLNHIATNFLALMRSGRFQCFPHPEFGAQLRSVVVKETMFGIRIDSGTGAGVRGCDDMVVAAAMAAQLALEAHGGESTIAVIRAGDRQRVTERQENERIAARDQAELLVIEQERRMHEYRKLEGLVNTYGAEAVEAICRHGDKSFTLPADLAELASGVGASTPRAVTPLKLVRA
jgi:hypothetical protein